MAVAAKLMAIGMIFISVLVGLGFFYISSPLSKELKKVHVEEIISQLINFVIFMWLGKIILNLPKFIQDPLAILAYPSDSSAFYVAILFTSIVLFYKNIKKKIDGFSIIKSFVLVFLVASFIYEFIEYIWNDNTYAFGYLTVLIILLVIYLLISERVTSSILMLTMLIGWSAGVLLLILTQPFATVFGFIIKPWFLALFFIVNVALLIIRKRD